MTTQQIWQEYHNDVKQFIFSKTHHHFVTDDLLQDVFIKVHTKLNSLKNKQAVKSWIFSIARNTVNDYFKKNQNKITTPVIEQVSETLSNQHTEKDCLQGIIKNLPKKYRAPLFLADIKGLKQEEVAKKLHQNIPTTKSQIQRARKLIAKGFIDCCGFEINKKGKLVGEIQEKEDCKVCNS